MAKVEVEIADVKKYFKEQLETAMESLTAKNKVDVDYPLTVEDYKLNHPKGALLVVYKGDEFKPSKVDKFQVQDRDIQIGVIVVARHKMDTMAPEEYIDFVRKAMTGKDLFEAFPFDAETDSGYIIDRPDSKVYPAESEWIKEDQQIWWYGITFIAPVTSVEQGVLNDETFP